jgi:hypothetical protein
MASESAPLGSATDYPGQALLPGQLPSRPREPQRVATYLKSGTRTYNQTIDRHYGLGRIDYSPNSKLQVNSSWIWSPQKINGYLPARDPRVDPPTNDLSVQGGYQPAQSYSASATYTAKSRLIFHRPLWL